MLFNSNLMLQLVVASAALITFSLFFTYRAFRQSKEEYVKLLQCANMVKALHTDILLKVTERTDHIEQLLTQKFHAAPSLVLPDVFTSNCKKYNLSMREESIALLIKEGQTYKAIGDRLFISDKTVAKHVQHIFEKAGVNNKVELIHKLLE